MKDQAGSPMITIVVFEDIAGIIEELSKLNFSSL